MITVMFIVLTICQLVLVYNKADVIATGNPSNTDIFMYGFACFTAGMCATSAFFDRLVHRWKKLYFK